MRSTLLRWTVVLATISSAAPTPFRKEVRHIVHENRDLENPSWIKRAHIPGGSRLPLRIGLTQSNLDHAHEYLMDVSSPSSINYGKHWTSEQIINTFAPSDERVQAVRQWLIESGIHHNRITHSDNKGWLAFDATATEAENLIGAQYHHYEERTSGKHAIGCDVYHVPEHVQSHIDYITPGVKLISSNRMPSDGSTKNMQLNLSQKHHQPIAPASTSLKHASLTNCAEDMTPNCIAALYDVPPAREDPVPGNEMGIYSSCQVVDKSDLNQFLAEYAPHIPAETYPDLYDINHALERCWKGSGEANLDFQMAYPLIYPQRLVGYQIDTFGNENLMLDEFDGSYCGYHAYGRGAELPQDDPAGGIWPTIFRPHDDSLQCGVLKPPSVLSISYGSWESHLPASYQQRQCNEFLKLGLQGTSIFMASGDSGVGKPKECLGKDKKIFVPLTPVNCPWVTTVGGTMMEPNSTNVNHEVVAHAGTGTKYGDRYSSGGGFSNVYASPDYQAAAIDTYFRDNNPPYVSYSGFFYNNLNRSFTNESFHNTEGVYNRIGRAYPDVAAIGLHTMIIYKGNTTDMGGTSASTPVFAAIINRINEERLRVGKSTVGFVNPALYSNVTILNDITEGHNPGCGTEGFSAAKGWDPVTGLGSPNYPKMLEYFMSLP